MDPRLTSSHLEGEMGVGASRVCRIKDDLQTEQITAYHPEQMSFSYTLLEPPSWVRSVTNTWSVESRGSDRSALTMDLDLRTVWWMIPLAPLLSIGFARLLGEVQEEFKHWAETGEPHPRKQAHSRKHARWRTAEILGSTSVASGSNPPA